MQTQREILSPKVLLVAAWLLVGLVALPVATAAQEVVYQTNQLTEQPKIADAGQARTAITRSYTAALQQAGLEGRVELAFIVNPDGSVDQESIQVLKTPHDSLGKAAEVAVARIKFQPGKKDGQAVRCQVLMPIVYAAGS